MNSKFLSLFILHIIFIFSLSLTQCILGILSSIRKMHTFWNVLESGAQIECFKMLPMFSNRVKDNIFLFIIQYNKYDCKIYFIVAVIKVIKCIKVNVCFSNGNTLSERLSFSLRVVKKMIQKHFNSYNQNNLSLMLHSLTTELIFFQSLLPLAGPSDTICPRRVTCVFMPSTSLNGGAEGSTWQMCPLIYNDS